MEHSIGVGAIVGLMTASSIYVWSSENFNKVQKTVLLIFVIFPPAQWLGILIVLAYNNYKTNNTIEKIQERKVDEVKTNLTDLKEKGILTEDEYKIKVEKIETEKEEQDLKNSTEYKQLKSLYDSGVLTKEELEEKINILKSKLNINHNDFIGEWNISDGAYIEFNRDYEYFSRTKEGYIVNGFWDFNKQLKTVTISNSRIKEYLTDFKIIEDKIHFIKDNTRLIGNRYKNDNRTV